MKAHELQEIAEGSINEERVKSIVDQAFKGAVRDAQKGKFSCYIWMRENHTDPNERTTPAEREEIIRRIEEEGFTIERSGDGTTMHWH